MAPVRPAPIDRVSPDDLVSLATDVGPRPMQVGAVVVLGGPVDPAALVDTLAARAATVPRLRQRLRRAPFGAGRPVWTDDADFDVTRHVTTRRCGAPGDEEALLAVAADEVWARLPRDRPLWRVVVVHGLADQRAAVVVAFHHVLADGIGGLAVLAHLVDGASGAPDATAVAAPPRPVPGTPALFLDAWRGRVEAMRRAPASWRRFRDAVRTLRGTPRPRASRSSLNRPTGAARALAVARVELAAVHQVARAHDATINDVLLSCVATTLREVLRRRGEDLDHLVVSVPVSTRRAADVSHLGNAVGTTLVDVPTTGTFADRVATVAARARAARGAPSAPVAWVVGPLFRLLAHLGVFGWFIDHQGTVDTFVTNLRGPEERLAVDGHPVLDVVPVALITGNVSVAFAVLSCAGQLDVTVVADPDVCPDWRSIHEVLQQQLDQLEP